MVGSAQSFSSKVAAAAIGVAFFFVFLTAPMLIGDDQAMYAWGWIGLFVGPGLSWLVAKRVYRAMSD